MNTRISERLNGLSGLDQQFKQTLKTFDQFFLFHVGYRPATLITNSAATNVSRRLTVLGLLPAGAVEYKIGDFTSDPLLSGSGDRMQRLLCHTSLCVSLHL